ncbi:MAG: sulfate ABC transporter permease subunit [Actinobacteria bacterium]|nr:sulfate ABC transporter permease subunit [Actinomycetota bacterium]
MATTSGAILAGQRRRKRVRAALLGLAVFYVAVLLLAPLVGIAYVALRPGLGIFSETFSDARVQHAFLLTGIITICTLVVTTLFGVVVAWTLSRDDFRGKKLMNALADLPFAVSPVTVGVMVVLLFGPAGWFESWVSATGIQVLFALPSMVLVTIFISIPFVIRGVVPVLQELGQDEEEAAHTLGASPLQSFFKVTLPNIKWGLAYGVALTTSRALGEVGAVLIVSGAIQNQTETATTFVLFALEERLDSQAYLVALTLAAVSVVLLTGIEIAKHRGTREQTR